MKHNIAKVTVGLAFRTIVFAVIAAMGTVTLTLGAAVPASARPVCNPDGRCLLAHDCTLGLGANQTTVKDGDQITITDKNGKKVTYTCDDGRWVSAKGFRGPVLVLGPSELTTGPPRGTTCTPGVTTCPPGVTTGPHFRMSATKLTKNCNEGVGTITITDKGGKRTTCTTDDGLLQCDDTMKGDNCAAKAFRKRDTKALVQEIRAFGARSVSKPSDSSTVWTQTVSLPTGDHGVAVLGAVVCTGLGGEFFASSDGAFGACQTPFAIVVCKDNHPGNNCVGFADTKRHAVATRKLIQALVAATGGGSTTPRGGSTTTTHGATTTTHGATTTTHGATTSSQPPPTTTPNVIQ